MEELAQLTNASASYDEITMAGTPANPLEFPEPKIARGIRVTATVHNPETGSKADVPNVIYEVSDDNMSMSHPPSQAYWIGRKLKKAIYGCVRSCTVLRHRREGFEYSANSWDVTSMMAAVKIVDWNAVLMNQGVHMENPIKEVSAMQFVASESKHDNVIRALDVMADDQYLYIFMPYCARGELFGYVERDGRFSEPEARFWFRQLLSGLYHLQKMGVCHRDISLENLLVDEETNCLIIDLGMCLRVPFVADDGSVTDVSEGTLRRLMTPQGQCGKQNYVAPEVLKNEEPFDGFAIDVWATGIILFIMLVGLPPFEWAHDEDPRFKMITRGDLAGMLSQWNRRISDDAMDLLQNMLMKDPPDRLSLMQIMDHRWVVEDNVSPPRHHSY